MPTSTTTRYDVAADAVLVRTITEQADRTFTVRFVLEVAGVEVARIRPAAGGTYAATLADGTVTARRATADLAARLALRTL